MKRRLIFLIGTLILAVIIIALVNKLIINKDGSIQEVSFNALVLENKVNTILVKPEEGSSELNSSDKIVVKVPIDNAVLKDLSEFTEGSKVKITYDGMIMESYPAQINAFNIELLK
ncbi:MAG: DUF3221 domain-containing protein [Tissierellia bacterium]|jgi:hypothetical protein|nr:DUF3221 domain-containing protein [Tissierellia bacterium]